MSIVNLLPEISLGSSKVGFLLLEKIAVHGTSFSLKQLLEAK